MGTVALSSYLLTFFLSKIGRLQILRSAMLSGQGKLELEDIRNYKIPLLERAFMDEIAKICDSIANIEAQSLACYKQAESTPLITSIINDNVKYFRFRETILLSILKLELLLINLLCRMCYIQIK